MGDISRENPNLIDKMVQIGIIEQIFIRFSAQIPQEIEHIQLAIYFINQVCLKKIGLEFEQRYQVLNKIVNIFLLKDFVTILSPNFKNQGSLAQELIELVNDLDDLKKSTAEVLLKLLDVILELQQQFV